MQVVANANRVAAARLETVGDRPQGWGRVNGDAERRPIGAHRKRLVRQVERGAQAVTSPIAAVAPNSTEPSTTGCTPLRVESSLCCGQVIGNKARNTSEEGRGSNREDCGGPGARVQRRVEIELNVGGQPQGFEEDVIVIEFRPPLRIARRLGHCFQIGLVPNDAKPRLVEVVAAEGIVVDPTPRDRGLDRGRGSPRTVRTHEETPLRIDILHCIERCAWAVARLLRHRGLAVPRRL